MNKMSEGSGEQFLSGGDERGEVFTDRGRHRGRLSGSLTQGVLSLSLLLFLLLLSLLLLLLFRSSCCLLRVTKLARFYFFALKKVMTFPLNGSKMSSPR